MPLRVAVIQLFCAGAVLCAILSARAPRGSAASFKLAEIHTKPASLRCVPLIPTASAGFEFPRIDNDTVPAHIALRWGVWHCQHRSGKCCTGHLVVRRLDGVSPVHNLSRITVERDWESRIVASRIGPDEFFTEISGPELHVLTPLFKGEPDYTYIMPYRVTLPGLYYVRLLHTHAHYRAVDNTVSWPIAHADDVLGDDAELHIGGETAADNVTALHASVLYPSSLPPCSRGMGEPGRWVAAMPFMFGPHVIQNYKWPFPRRVSMHDYIWTPYSCTRQVFTAARLAQCTANKSFAFHGDSQTRTFFNLLLNTIGGVSNVAQKGSLENQCHEINFSSRLPGSTWCFIANPIGISTLLRTPAQTVGTNLSSLHKPARWDVLFANFGQHPAASKHWLPSRYRATLRSFRTAVAELNPLVFIWATSQVIIPAIGPFKVESAKSQDWRTRSRLRFFSDIADEEVSHYPTRVLDAYGASLAMATAATDANHIYAANFQKLLTERFLSIICYAAS